MQFLFLDTETTGIGPEDRLCQVAFKCDAMVTDKLFKPPVPISIGAMATSHITNRMVVDCEPFIGSNTLLDLQSCLQDRVFVAHNAAFDIEMLKREGVVVGAYICTLKLARYLDTKAEMERHSLQYLRYWYDLQIEARAHDAAGDIAVLEVVFDRLTLLLHEQHPDLGVVELTELMLKVSREPSLIRKMPFGKHKGLPMEQVPADYLYWLKGTTLEPDMAYSVDRYIAMRDQHPL